jgi:hypothetical protein
MSAPRELRVGQGERARTYSLAPDRHAVHGPAARAVSRPILVLEDGEVAVVGGEAAPPGAGPVYVTPAGGLAVPTGLVLVRFRSGTLALEEAPRLRDAGFEVERSLDYAPEAVWVRPAKGSVADALESLPRLASLPGVEAAEPQLLQPRSHR